MALILSGSWRAAVWGYFLKRLIFLVVVMLGVSIIIFGLINLAPGDPSRRWFFGAGTYRENQ
ncbi:hypothetical protein E308F_20930 [Moorella sp. E308F]|nr:hypothetical protein E308F_20930 [Moorella sp. E308F]